MGLTGPISRMYNLIILYKVDIFSRLINITE